MVGFCARGSRGAEAKELNPCKGAECELTIRELLSLMI